MSFYISPPGGNISLQKLTQFAVARFNFLSKVYDTGGNRLEIFDILKDTENVQDSECLIEGTVKDRLSHFILRLACCSNSDMTAFLVKAETLLFDFRFTCMTEEELCKLFKSTDYLRKGNRLKNTISSDTPLYVRQFFETLSQIKGDNLKWRTVVRQYLNGKEVCFMVPFWTVLHFVATRQTVLKNGIAHVPVCRLRETVTSLFKELLQNGIKQAADIFHTDERRIKILFKTLKVCTIIECYCIASVANIVMFYEHYRDQYPGCDMRHDLCHTEVDGVAHMFPPCMSHLHRSLRMSHRLKHHSRIQYSLFLKEAGLSVHEALMFWRKEYSQSPSNNDGCCHTWSKDEGRYTYNIRHLYGLEGSRINYRGHSCTALQESYHGPCESGGCPFSHFDSSHILELLHAEGITSAVSTDQILQLARQKLYSQACSLYFMEKIKKMQHAREPCQNVQFKCFRTDENDTHEVLHSKDCVQQYQNVKDSDSEHVRGCYHGNTECVATENFSCCCHDKGHNCGNRCCCKRLCYSEREPNVTAVISNSKSCGDAFEQACNTSNSSICSHQSSVKDEQSSATTRVPNDDLLSCICPEKLSLFNDKNITSETNYNETKSPFNPNMIKCLEKKEGSVRKSYVGNEKDMEIKRYLVFQKPVEYLEKYKLFMKEVNK
ncbi:uncharacterized protein LOC123561011 [Mercenaria mercenaria]|uniref:uncharacterized protein LOC123561011 n=1 Tax=Mercenaria mercenaria TaxID=6596 RepID=UPI00234F8438|nr:uncharacterized protein LOC123561011 [Mercenaria mercenaria]